MDHQRDYPLRVLSRGFIAPTPFVLEGKVGSPINEWTSSFVTNSAICCSFNPERSSTHRGNVQLP